jgi:hypothetical protein
MTEHAGRTTLALRRLRATEVKVLHGLLADEAIRPGALFGLAEGAPADLLPFLADERNVALGTFSGDEPMGALLFAQIEPGVYEVHTMARAAVRGRAYVAATREALRVMFLHGDAMELYTRVPSENKAALGLARLVGGKREFTRGDGTPVYVLRWADWLWGSGGTALAARGEWFHQRLEAQFAAQGREHVAHAPHPDHDRMVGATCEMILAGNVVKALVLYNRWAALAGYAPVSVVVSGPLVLDIGDALVQVDFAGRDFLLLDASPEQFRAAPAAPSNGATHAQRAA